MAGEQDWRDLTCSGGSRVEGIGRPRVEPSFIPTSVDAMVKVPDALSLAAMRHVSRQLGRRVGGSTGTNFIGVLQAAQWMREAGHQGSIVSILCDSGGVMRRATTIRRGTRARALMSTAPTHSWPLRWPGRTARIAVVQPGSVVGRPTLSPGHVGVRDGVSVTRCGEGVEHRVAQCIGQGLDVHRAVIQVQGGIQDAGAAGPAC